MIDICSVALHSNPSDSIHLSFLIEMATTKKETVNLDNPTSPSLLDDSEELAASYGINERSLLRKLDLHLLPAVTLLYLLSFLDRSNGEHHFAFTGSIDSS